MDEFRCEELVKSVPGRFVVQKTIPVPALMVQLFVDHVPIVMKNVVPCCSDEDECVINDEITYREAGICAECIQEENAVCSNLGSGPGCCSALNLSCVNIADDQDEEGDFRCLPQGSS